MTSHPSLLDVILQGESAMFTVVKIVKRSEPVYFLSVILRGRRCLFCSSDTGRVTTLTLRSHQKGTRGRCPTSGAG